MNWICKYVFVLFRVNCRRAPDHAAGLCLNRFAAPDRAESWTVNIENRSYTLYHLPNVITTYLSSRMVVL